jgi:hypothetical protein
MIIFFLQKEDYVTPLTVMHHMDNNHRTLKRNDDKFYMLTINPSGEEQQHLIEKVTGEKTGEFPELSPEQQKEVLAEMKRLTRECMDEYARNFYREKIRSGDDLVWYGRVETERHYKGDDPEVKAGKAKAGERKPGLQLHVHIIVSRMDRSQTVSLSPLSKSRGNRRFSTAGMWWSALTVPSGPPGAPPGSTGCMATSLTAGPRMRA